MYWNLLSNAGFIENTVIVTPQTYILPSVVCLLYIGFFFMRESCIQKHKQFHCTLLLKLAMAMTNDGQEHVIALE